MGPTEPKKCQNRPEIRFILVPVKNRNSLEFRRKSSCQSMSKSRPAQIAQKNAKTGPTEPKKCQNWPEIRGFFSSPSRLKLTEYWTKITFLEHAKFCWMKLPKKIAQMGPNRPKKAQKGPIRSFWQRSNLPLSTPPRFFLAVAFLMRFWPYLTSNNFASLQNFPLDPKLPK